MSPAPDPVATILAYHRRTKHHLHRYARSAGYLDWANQPDPFRTYAGAEVIDLPLLADALRTPFADLFVPCAVRPRRADLTSVAVLFELALGLSAWKEHGRSRWALRCNPSSGNLHPTEGYAVLPHLPELPAGVYHYTSRDHQLQRRASFTPAGAGALGRSLPPGCFLVGLSTIPWREAWKYGERAYRYCQHDLGHAIAAVRYAAGALGWGALLLDHLGDEAVARWLGLDRDGDFATISPLDHELPGGLLLVGPPPVQPVTPDPAALAGAAWAGAPNPLSREHVHWEVIDEAHRAAWRPPSEVGPPSRGGQQAVPLGSRHLPAVVPLGSRHLLPAERLIRQRRSCLDLDGRTPLDAPALYSLLDTLLPRPGVPPWDALPWEPQLDLVLFVHRVRGLEAGLYAFERVPDRHEVLQGDFSSRFEWAKPEGCPDHLGLYRLHAGDLRAQARTVSCHQDIAADGAFSCGMLAWFEESIRELGAWWYRRLFWEAGVLGQVLYLGAEAVGARGTGIGCFFDDAVHQLLGLRGERWQSLYHFTAGAPVEDERLRTIAPYAHLQPR